MPIQGNMGPIMRKPDPQKTICAVRCRKGTRRE
jgi:hypothetical protein